MSFLKETKLNRKRGGEGMKVTKIKKLKKPVKTLNELIELLRWSYTQYKYWHKVACVFGCLFSFALALLIGSIVIRS